MEPLTSLSIASSGIICSIGNNPTLVTHAVNAGISHFGDSVIFGRNSTPLKMALVPDDALAPLVGELQGEPLDYKARRMLQMAGVALKDAASGADSRISIPLFLAGPESLPHCPTTLTGTFIRYLAKQSEVNLDIPNSRTILYGRAAGIHAIELAFNFLSATDTPFALVGGVDTCLDLRKLGYLDAGGRIKVEGAMDAFIPGEGASFLLLKKPLPGDAAMAKVHKPASAMEKGHIYSAEPYSGEGLAEAFRQAIGNTQRTIQAVYSSQNGEFFSAKEFGVACTRNHSHLSDNVVHEHPAEYFGDLGAAMAGALIMLASAKRQPSLVYCSSDMGQRAAVCVN